MENHLENQKKRSPIFFYIGITFIAVSVIALLGGGVGVFFITPSFGIIGVVCVLVDSILKRRSSNGKELPDWVSLLVALVAVAALGYIMRSNFFFVAMLIIGFGVFLGAFVIVRAGDFFGSKIIKSQK